MTDAPNRTLPFGPDIEARIADAIAPLGLALCHVAWRPGRRRGVLTLTVESPVGVSLDDCAAASHAVSDLLDRLDPVEGSYVLEVESPGLDRPLYSLADCERFRGRRVRVQLRAPVEKTSRLKGLLEEVSGEALTILDEDRKRRYTVQFGDVKVARLIPEP
ncbi:MAG: ribosome maturation factor RimP [Acidobacteria bacterium]|nr:MAG: ribosome maturation factor RimP [Acidobacteriota bacterium]MCE7958318.1 ribosome maturation factor RimP [Acidobacteria bacterium ACB2]